MPNLWKLTPAIAVTTVVALLLAGVLIVVYGEQSYKAQKAKEIGVQAQILASSVSAALVFDDQPAAVEYVSALKANPEVRAAAVYDATGALFASYSRSEEPLLPDTIATPEPHFEGGDLIMVAPVTVAESDTPIGTVYLRTVTEPLARRITRYGVVGLLVMLASLVVAVFGMAHSALTKANAELERRAADLSTANRNLQAQMAERAKAEEALRQSQKMEAIGQLSGGIAHDFNNLLMIIMGNLEIIRKRVGQGRTDVGRHIDTAIAGVDRGANLTQRILAFSRRQPLSPKPVSMSRLVAGADTLLRHSIHELIEIDMRLASEWWALCDPNQMENVILNLVINARDAMPEGGRLTIETTDVTMAASEGPDGVPAGDYVRLSIADTGIGMSDDVRRKALDPFFTTKPQGQGTGLGLSMVFGYVKQSNGHFEIESTLGKGTRITILMPRYLGEIADHKATPSTDTQSPTDAGPTGRTRKPTILVVEDDADVRTLAVETIQGQGCDVLEAGDGIAAADLLGTDVQIDLLVSDIRLPGIDGFRVADLGRARRPGLKVLLMTGFVQETLPENLARAGARILHKPFSVEELVSEVAAALKEGRCAEGGRNGEARGEG